MCESALIHTVSFAISRTVFKADVKAKKEGEKRKLIENSCIEQQPVVGPQRQILLLPPSLQGRCKGKKRRGKMKKENSLKIAVLSSSPWWVGQILLLPPNCLPNPNPYVLFFLLVG